MAFGHLRCSWVLSSFFGERFVFLVVFECPKWSKDEDEICQILYILWPSSTSLFFVKYLALPHCILLAELKQKFYLSKTKSRTSSPLYSLVSQKVILKCRTNFRAKTAFLP